MVVGMKSYGVFAPPALGFPNVRAVFGEAPAEDAVVNENRRASVFAAAGVGLPVCCNVITCIQAQTDLQRGKHRKN